MTRGVYVHIQYFSISDRIIEEVVSLIVFTNFYMLKAIFSLKYICRRSYGLKILANKCLQPVTHPVYFFDETELIDKVRLPRLI